MLEAPKVLWILNWVLSTLRSGDDIWERPQSFPPLQVPAQLPTLSEHTLSASLLTQLCLSVGHEKTPESVPTSIQFHADQPSKVNTDFPQLNI